MPPTLYAYIWKHSRRAQIVLCVLTFVVSFLTTVPLELQRRIVDDALPAARLPLLLLLSAIYLGVLLVQGGLKYGLNVYRGRLVEEITRDLRLTIFDATRPRTADDHVHHGREPAEAGAIVSMVAAEAEDLAGFVGDSFSFPLLQGGTAAFVVGYLLWVQPTIAVFGILLYLPQLVVVPVGQGAINRWSARHVRLVRQIGDLIALPFATVARRQVASRLPPAGRRQLPRARHHLPHQVLPDLLRQLPGRDRAAHRAGGRRLARHARRRRGRHARRLHLRLPEAGRSLGPAHQLLPHALHRAREVPADRGHAAGRGYASPLKSSSRAAMRPVSDWSMIWRAQRVAARRSRPRMRCFTRGSAVVAIDSSRMPRPSRSAA